MLNTKPTKRPNKMRKNFLVFSDLHITPTGYDPTVLVQLRAVIMKARPDYIICTGDLGEFASQNRLVKDRGSFSVAQELTAVVDMFERYIIAPVKAMQAKARNDKKKLYKPCICVCMGNHDAPVQDALGTVLSSLGVLVIPHKVPMSFEGITFCHTFDKGFSGTACVSAEDILKTTMSRTISGHSHVRSISEDRDVKGSKIFAIKLPCATMKYPDWTPQGSMKWDRGFLWLTVETDSDWYQYTFKEVVHGRRV